MLGLTTSQQADLRRRSRRRRGCADRARRHGADLDLDPADRTGRAAEEPAPDRARRPRPASPAPSARIARWTRAVQATQSMVSTALRRPAGPAESVDDQSRGDEASPLGSSRSSAGAATRPRSTTSLRRGRRRLRRSSPVSAGSVGPDPGLRFSLSIVGAEPPRCRRRAADRHRPVDDRRRAGRGCGPSAEPSASELGRARSAASV